jgi:hypothetical protein
MSTTLSLIALITSVLSVVVTVYIYRGNKQINMDQSNLSLRNESEKMLKTCAELLSLHGINPAELKKDNISQEEFYYIFTSLRAGEAYYIIKNKQSEKVSDYRAQFLKNDKVKLVYQKYLKDKLIASSVFVKMVDKFYLESEKPTT